MAGVIHFGLGTVSFVPGYGGELRLAWQNNTADGSSTGKCQKLLWDVALVDRNDNPKLKSLGAVLTAITGCIILLRHWWAF